MGSGGRQFLMSFTGHKPNHVSLQCLLLAGLLGWAFAFSLWADETPLPSMVWHSVPDDAPAPRKPWVIRDRAIAVNPQSLQTLKDAAARPHPPAFIELFDGARYELDIASTISRINDSAVIRGLLKDSPQGDFTFYISGSVMAGTIHVGDRLFKIEHVSNGHHHLLEVNQAKLPPD
jgi:hypothetical protein